MIIRIFTHFILDGNKTLSFDYDLTKIDTYTKHLKQHLK